MVNIKTYSLRHGVVATVDLETRIAGFEFPDGSVKEHDLTIDEFHLDMDGTFVDLYSVDECIPRLGAGDMSVFSEARPLINMRTFVRCIKVFLAHGIKVILDSKCPPDAPLEQMLEVCSRKMNWGYIHMPSIMKDLIKVFRGYYEPKTSGRGKKSILFDDEARNRALFDGYSMDARDMMPFFVALAELMTIFDKEERR